MTAVNESEYGSDEGFSERSDSSRSGLPPYLPQTKIFNDATTSSERLIDDDDLDSTNFPLCYLFLANEAIVQ
jgi:hypothetical protein